MVTALRQRETASTARRRLLVAAIPVGLVAGAVASTVGWVVGQPQIDQSIAWELSSQGDPGLYVPEMSRFTQQIGMVVALCVAALGLSVLVALALGLAARGTEVTARSVLIGTVLTWVVFVGVPLVLAPPSPPGTGSASDVAQRTVRWTITIAIGLLAVFAAFCVRRALDKASPRSRSVVTAIVGMGVVIVLALLLSPAAAAPDGFPADVMWNFRLASLATQTALWVTIGVGFWWSLQPGGRAVED